MHTETEAITETMVQRIKKEMVETEKSPRMCAAIGIGAIVRIKTATFNTYAQYAGALDTQHNPASVLQLKTKKNDNMKSQSSLMAVCFTLPTPKT